MSSPISLLKKNRSVLLMLLDMVTVFVCYMISLSLYYTTSLLYLYFGILQFSIYLCVLIYFGIFYFFQIYDSVWRYADVEDYFRCLITSLVASGVFGFADRLMGGKNSIAFYMINAVIITLGIISTRMAYRMYRGIVLSRNARLKKSTHHIVKENLAIVGAGEAGIMIKREIDQQTMSKYIVKCMVDDDPEKLGRTIFNTKVEGPIDQIQRIVDKYNIDTILVALPSISEKERQKILSVLAATGKKLEILPSIIEVIDMQKSGTGLIEGIKPVEIEDLLGREPVDLISPEIQTYLQGKRILVTGGGGSIGSELCRQIAKYDVAELTILDIYENNAYDIQMELLQTHGKALNLDVVIASVRDENKIREIFKEKSPQIVFHAAAHKHVPLMERTPEEAIKNNILGTYNVAKAATDTGVEKFVLISTDKAVNPTNIMGATKRMAEMIVQTMDKSSKTEYVAVRFGNVLGSNGSVIPLFKKQIQAGGPVTVTDQRVTRFFMTIPEAAQLVLKAGTIAKGGEIFILDMGEPIKIKDLAENLIRLSGLRPYEDIDIIYTGLRPGEKLYEELLIDEEGLQSTKYEKIFIGKPLDINPEELKDKLKVLVKVIEENPTPEEVRGAMAQLMDSYHPEEIA